MRNERAAGVIYAAAAYTLWGILPLYWRLVESVSSTEILAHRILWAFVFVAVIITATRQWGDVKRIASDRKQLIFVILSSILISFNWGLYIWAVNSDRIVDSSLGYYINPLFVVVLGVLIFKEKLSFWQGIALGAASLGVVIKTIQYGGVPWISLGLATSFGLYGAMKKFVKTNSMTGLTLETAVVTPAAAAYIIYRQISGQGAFATKGTGVILLLLGAGVVTAVPLLLFAKGAKRIPLSLLGFTQYISPTISLFLGVFVYRENFTAVDIISFGCIWLALVIYSMSQVGLLKRKTVITGNTSQNKIEDAV
ncbi:MAG: EamA family transporter RarD [Bacillota bacterium]|nr:EamA family transporter RarD [Bacillota bacterium]